MTNTETWIAKCKTCGSTVSYHHTPEGLDMELGTTKAKGVRTNPNGGKNARLKEDFLKESNPILNCEGVTKHIHSYNFPKDFTKQ